MIPAAPRPKEGLSALPGGGEGDHRPAALAPRIHPADPSWVCPRLQWGWGLRATVSSSQGSPRGVSLEPLWGQGLPKHGHMGLSVL